MAITLKGASPVLYGLSTDDKPETADINQLLEELDTGDKYYFDGETWAKVGAVSNA